MIAHLHKCVSLQVSLHLLDVSDDGEAFELRGAVVFCTIQGAIRVGDDTLAVLLVLRQDGFKAVRVGVSLQHKLTREIRAGEDGSGGQRFF